MMELLDEILEILKDGKWHPVKEFLEIVVHRTLTQKTVGEFEIVRTEPSPLKLLLCINFLEHYKLVQVDRSHGRVKLWSAVIDFLKEIKKLET